MSEPLKAEAKQYMQQFHIPLSPRPLSVAILTVPFPMTKEEYDSLLGTMESWKAALTHTSFSSVETDDAPDE